MEDIVKLVENLSETDRLIASLFFVEECSPSEISYILNMPENKVKEKISHIILKAGKVLMHSKV